MEVSQILSAFNLSNGERNLPKEAQQNISQNLSNILANQVFRGEALQNNAGQYSTQIILNPNISDASQELTFRTDANLKAIGNFSVAVENINFNQTSSNIGAVNFTGKIISQNPENIGQTYQLVGAIKITDAKILASLSSPQNNSAEGASILNKLANFDTSIISKLPNNLQAQTPINNQNYTNFLIKNNLENFSGNIASLNISQITAENGEILAQNSSSLGKANIFGKFEYLANSNESVIKTEYGNFRINGQVNLPNNSNLVFNLEATQNLDNNRNIGQSFSSLYLLKSAVAGDVLNLQAYAKILTQSPLGLAILEKAFPNVKDGQSAYKSLVAISSLKNAGENFLDNTNLSAKMQILTPEDNEILNSARSLMSAIMQTSLKIGNSEGEIYYSYILPFFNGQKLDFHRVFVSQEQNSKGKQKSQGKFLMELVENEQGRIEIEGNFTKNYNRVRKLDMVIRSEEIFSDETKNELLEIYNNISESMGYSGNLLFQRLFYNISDNFNPAQNYSKNNPNSISIDT